MYLKLVIVNSMGDIVKEVSIVGDEEFVEGGGEQLAQALRLMYGWGTQKDYLFLYSPDPSFKHVKI
jgi:hypothetical protein